MQLEGCHRIHEKTKKHRSRAYVEDLTNSKANELRILFKIIRSVRVLLQQ
jgi:hypothetical protein